MDDEGRVIPVLIGSTQVGTARIVEDGAAIQSCVVSIDVDLIGYTLDQNAEGEIIAMILGPDDNEEEENAQPVFMVQHDFLHGWDDAGWQEDGKPLRFATREDALSAIHEHCLATAVNGMNYNVNDYRVVEVPANS